MKVKKKCILSKKGRCTSDYSPLKCDGLDIPDDCVYALKPAEEDCDPTGRIKRFNDKKEFDLSKERQKLFEKITKEKLTDVGMIFGLINNQDKEFINDIIDLHDELEFAEYNDVEKRIDKLQELKERIKEKAGRQP